MKETKRNREKRTRKLASGEPVHTCLRWAIFFLFVDRTSNTPVCTVDCLRRSPAVAASVAESGEKEGAAEDVPSAPHQRSLQRPSRHRPQLGRLVQGTRGLAAAAAAGRRGRKDHKPQTEPAWWARRVLARLPSCTPHHSAGPRRRQHVLWLLKSCKA